MPGPQTQQKGTYLLTYDLEADADYAGCGWSPPRLVAASGACGVLLLAYTVGCGVVLGF